MERGGGGGGGEGGKGKGGGGGGGGGRRGYIQWNLRIKDTLGAGLLSFIQRLSSGGRFDSICNF